MPYESLDSTQIIATIHRLVTRVDRRFPGSGLGKVCRQLLEVGRRSQQRSQSITQPILGLRIGSALLIGLIVVGICATLWGLRAPEQDVTFIEFVQVLEAGINDVVLIGAAVFFLITVETRIKRRRALQAIHELRSMAHIIDMHQLTKDPDRARRRAPQPAMDLDGSIADTRTLTADQLVRYLDYCSEMLSLIGKIAALYVQRFDDSVAIASVNEVENLTTGLSRKIWQKIMILQAAGPDESIPWVEPRPEVPAE
ncbi:hypothetical protein HED60_11710 [Planctomycetales bacterium ZRK34]|nr:hypothetical protein HED60_11710 [Planctomycetales bacterium ZRK34]